MEKLKVLPIEFYKFSCPNEVLDSILADIPNLNFKKDSNNYNSGPYYNEKLFIWLNECLSKVGAELLSEGLKFTITDCWINKAYKLQQTNVHLHRSSILSGLLYFSDEESGNTVFSCENLWYDIQIKNFLKLTDNNRNLHLREVIKPEKGKLILFPSQVTHGVTPYLGSGIRHTLAFNTFITGEIHKNITNTLERLNIHTIEFKQTPKSSSEEKVSTE